MERELDAADLLLAGRVVALEGDNFSGRTALIRAALAGGDSRQAVHSTDSHSAYVGPEVYNALSGLAGTVKGELLLHSGSSVTGFSRHVASLLAETGLDRLMSRNPFTLSGGEQSCLAVASALCLAPGAIGFDCALEQLALPLKVLLLQRISESAAELSGRTRIVLADNRLAELGSCDSRVRAESFHTAQKIGVAQPGPVISHAALDGESDYSTSSGPCDEPGSLDIFDLCFSYPGGMPVLEGVSASLQPGSVYVLEGPNGAGKSTLAKVLCGCLTPVSGRLEFRGEDFRPWRSPGRTVGYHFQNPDLQLFSASVEEEVSAGPAARLSSGKSGLAQLGKRLDTLLATFGLFHLRREHPLDLPFVLRKRVALAATIAMGSPWLILDEPSLGQDDRNAGEVAQIIRQLARGGAGVIVISHAPSFRGLLDASVLRLENGRLSQTVRSY